MSPETTLTRDDNGKIVEAKIGQTMIIELPENPTTGYVWTLKHRTGIVHLSNSRCIAANESAIGGGGMRRFFLDV